MIEMTYDFDDVLIVPQTPKNNQNISSRKDVILENECFHGTYGIPIIASNMYTIGTFEVAKILQKFKIYTSLHKFYTLKDFKNIKQLDFKYIIPSCGIKKDDVERLDDIIKYYGEDTISSICLDVANGYMNSFMELITYFRLKYFKMNIIAGQVSTIEGCKNLSLAGADFCKGSIGSGSVCTTRITAGVGIPQFSFIQKCSPYYNIVSDGGCVTSADVAKAFGAGARYVMLGGMFANCKQTGNHFYGMSSEYARKKHFNDIEKYKTSEGKSVEFKENQQKDLCETVENILGGLRSAISYCGKSSLKEFIGSAEFVAVNRTHNKIFEK